MKDCLSVPSLGWKYSVSSRCENDEPIYSYTDIYKRHFMRQAFKGGKDEGIDGGIDNKNTMPSQSGAFMLSNSQKNYE